MSFEQKLDNHRNVFKANIRGMGLLAALGVKCEQTIDQYGMAALFKNVQNVENPTEFVTLLFLDALMNSCAYANGVDFLHRINRDVIVLNTYNCFEPWANISHRLPQVILGLKRRWLKKDVEVFNALFKEYIQYYKDKLPPEVFNTLKEDSDLSNMKREYPAIGIIISKNVLEEFQKLRGEI